MNAQSTNQISVTAMLHLSSFVEEQGLGDTLLVDEISAASAAILTPNAKKLTFNDLIALGNGQNIAQDLSEADLQSLDTLSYVPMSKYQEYKANGGVTG